jgi:hypothetical protein
LSRDCDCFDDSRQWAYQNVLAVADATCARNKDIARDTSLH